MIENQRRASDASGWRRLTCWLALRASETWDWIDKRQLFERFVALAILYGTVKVTAWAMTFAEHGDRPGIEVAAIIAAVIAPYMALQGAAIAFMFKARMG